MPTIAKKLGLITALVAILVFLVFAYGFARGLKQRTTAGEEKSTATINGAMFTLEIANTEEKRRMGLSERDALCANCGMLFIFPDKTNASFWMKGMRFNLDILWLDHDRVVHMEKNIPYNSSDIFTPTEKSDMVLEINAGMADTYHMAVGDMVTFK